MSKKPPLTRRDFIKKSLIAGASAGLSVSILGLISCEDENSVKILTSGKTPDFITSNELFYLQFGNETLPADYPNLTTTNWQLEVLGAVTSPTTFGFQDLQALAGAHEITFLKTMRCILDSPFEPLISNAYWTGVPLKQVLEQVGVSSSAKRLRITGGDGFRNNIKIEDALKEPNPGELPIILCYKMNGVDLPVEHGFPVRIIFPEKFGFKNMKWVQQIEVSESDDIFGTYEVDFGFFDEGDLQPISYLTQPFVPVPAEDEGTIPTGAFQLVGTALTGNSPVARVEVKIQEEAGGGTFADAPWQEAEMVPQNEVEFFIENFAGRNPAEFIEQFKKPGDFQYPFPNVWIIWRFDLNVTGTGKLKISVRATSGAGFTQPEKGTPDEDTNPFNGDTNVISIIVQKTS